MLASFARRKVKWKIEEEAMTANLIGILGTDRDEKEKGREGTTN